MRPSLVAVMPTCSSRPITVSLGLGRVRGHLGFKADVEVVSTISPGWKTPDNQPKSELHTLKVFVSSLRRR